MPAVLAPRKTLAKSALPAALETAKTQLYSDTTATRSSTTSPSNPSLTALRSIAWSPTGALIATADSRVLRVWNPDRTNVKNSTEMRLPPPEISVAPATTGRPLPVRTPAPQHLMGTERIAWNPSREAELASVGSDGVVRFWDVRTKSQMVGEVNIGGEGFSMAWRPGGEELVVGTKDDTLIPISRSTLSEINRYPQGMQTNQIAFSNGGDELLLTTGDGQLKVLDYPSMEILHSVGAHTSSSYVVAECPRGRHLAVGGSDAQITLWDTRDFICHHSLAEMTGPVRSLSFTFDGTFIAGGSEEGKNILVAHVESGEYIHTIETANPTPCVAWHPSRYWLAYTGDGGLKILGGGGGLEGSAK